MTFHQTSLKLFCVALVVLIAAMLGWKQVQSRLNSATGDGGRIETTEASTEVPTIGAQANDINRDITLGSFGQEVKVGEGEGLEQNEQQEDRERFSLRVGVIGSTPQRDDLTAIKELPLTETQMRLAYRDAKNRTCRILIPGAPVRPPQSGVRPGRAGTFGRVSALSIGLKMDPAGRGKLPKLVQNQVEKYLRDHRLSIQPTLYHDADGQLYFGTDCQTAFYELDRPGVTIKAEPMIDSAISRFRALGIVSSTEAKIRNTMPDAGTSRQITSLGRTLAMAFTFEIANRDAIITSDRGQQATELLLLHLPADANASDPQVQVYVTSDRRMTLHRLNTRGEKLNDPTPTISADVRFGKTVMMGMYPADPIVTGIHFRSEGVVAMEAIQRMTRTSNDRNESGQPTPVLTVTEVLDQFGELSGSSL